MSVISFRWTGEPDQLDDLSSEERKEVIAVIIRLLKSNRIVIRGDSILQHVGDNIDIIIEKGSMINIESREGTNEKSNTYSISCV